MQMKPAKHANRDSADDSRATKRLHKNKPFDTKKIFASVIHQWVLQNDNTPPRLPHKSLTPC